MSFVDVSSSLSKYFEHFNAQIIKSLAVPHDLLWGVDYGFNVGEMCEICGTKKNVKETFDPIESENGYNYTVVLCDK